MPTEVGMKILVIGSGGREHALVWKLAQSQRVTKLFCAPGNAGIADLAECVPSRQPTSTRCPAFATEHKIDLTIVGPEAPLCAGIVDVFHSNALRIFGPNKRAAQLEGSKVFTKQILLKYNVPTAGAAIFNDADAARAHLRKVGAPIVVKADGLAAGKGVIVASSVEEAERAVAEIMEEKVFGGPSRKSSSRNVCAAKNSPSWRSSTANHFACWPPRKITSGHSTATAVRTRAGWALIRPRRCWTRNSTPKLRTSFSARWRDCRRKASNTGACSMPA